MAKDKIYDILPECALNMNIDRSNDSWNNSTHSPNSFNKNKVNSILEAIDNIIEDCDSVYDNNKNYYMIKNKGAYEVENMILNQCENITKNDLSYYCAFTEIMGDTFIRVLK
jgi:hypothetical protein